MTYPTPALQVLSTQAILTHEETSPDRVVEVAIAAIQSSVIDYPIIVGRTSVGQFTKHIVLDGHHRLEAARTKLGLINVPVRIIDYENDVLVAVEAWRESERVEKHDVLRAALIGPNMPIKTSRHTFGFPTEPCNVSLTALRAPGLSSVGA